MKKYIILLLVLIMTVSMAISVSAQSIETNPPVPEYTEPVPESAIPETTESMTRDEGDIPEENIKWDSLNVDPDEISQLMIKKPNSVVMEKYLIPFIGLFRLTTNAQEIIKNQSPIEVYIILNDDEIISHQIIDDGKAEEYYMDDAPHSVDARDYKNISFMKRGKEVLSKISEDIEVYNTYYFEDRLTFRCGGIYYETNLGNYFLYTKHREYLFPVDDFAEIMVRVKEENRRRYETEGKTMGTYVDIGSFVDLSNYDVNSSSFDLKAGHDELFGLDGNNESPDTPAFFENKVVIWGSAAAAAALLVAVVVIVTVRVKKKKMSAEQ